MGTTQHVPDIRKPPTYPTVSALPPVDAQGAIAGVEGGGIYQFVGSSWILSGSPSFSSAATGVSDSATVDLTLTSGNIAGSVIPSGVLAFPLSGLSVASGTVSGSDSNLQAFGKLQGTDESLDARIDTYDNLVKFASADPTVIPIDAPAGSLIFYAAGPQWFLKRDAGSSTNVYPVDLPTAGNSGNWSTGWKDTTGLGIALSGTTVCRVTLSQPQTIFLSGRPHVLPSGTYDSAVTGSTPSQHWFYFDDTSNVLKNVGVPVPSFATNVITAAGYYNGSALINLAWEPHGLRDTKWHAYTHLNEGLRYYSGLNATFTTSADSVNNPGAVANVETVYFGTGVCFDEDLQTNIGTAPWDGVVLGTDQTLAAAASLPIYYFNGTAITRLAPMADHVPFSYTGANGTPQRNNAGTLTNATTGQYVVTWIFASTLLGQDTLFIRPNNNAVAYTSLAQAAQASESSLVWSSFPVAEVKSLYRLIFRVNTTWSSTHRSKLVQFDDLRSQKGSPIAGVSATAHGALSGRDAQNQHPLYAISPQWVTGVAYLVGNIVAYNNMLFSCVVAHTGAAAFLTDFASGNWTQTARTSQNRQDNTSVAGDYYPADAFASGASGTSATFTIGLGGLCYEFLISHSSGKSIVCACDYNSSIINCLSDPDSVFSPTVAATKLCVTKATGSGAILVTNNLASGNIGFLPVRTACSAATAWT